MSRGLHRFAVLTVFCILLAGCGKPQKSENTFTRELSPPKIPPPGELLSQAENAKSSDEKLSLFQQLITAYPDSPQVDEAQFMVGFVLHEDLQRPADAREAFRVLKERFPDSEWNDDAERLMSEMPPDTSASPME